LIADDHSIVRSGLKILITKNFMAQIDEATDGNEVIEFIKKKNYELAILDINMPNTNSTRLIEYMRTQQEQVKILIFSMNPEHIYAKRYFKIGVNGFLNKEAEDDEIQKAIQIVLSGKRYTSQKVAELLMNEGLYGSKENPFDHLSSREFEVASLMVQGHSFTEICDILNVHSSTIGTHKTHLFEKLHINNLLELNELAKLYEII
jgi:two-component system, NarL family, invasion response regulator UvrY